MRAEPSNSFHTLAHPVPGIRARSGAITTFACALTLTACGGGGGGGTIPQAAGEDILAQLRQVEEQVEAGDCDGAQVTAAAVASAIESLPEEVDGELRQTLVTASGRLQAQTRDPEQCVELEPVPTGPSGVEGVAEEEDG